MIQVVSHGQDKLQRGSLMSKTAVDKAGPSPLLPSQAAISSWRPQGLEGQDEAAGGLEGCLQPWKQNESTGRSKRVFLIAVKPVHFQGHRQPPEPPAASSWPSKAFQRQSQNAVRCCHFPVAPHSRTNLRLVKLGRSRETVVLKGVRRN